MTSLRGWCEREGYTDAGRAFHCFLLEEAFKILGSKSITWFLAFRKAHMWTPLTDPTRVANFLLQITSLYHDSDNFEQNLRLYLRKMFSSKLLDFMTLRSYLFQWFRTEDKVSHVTPHMDQLHSNLDSLMAHLSTVSRRKGYWLILI
jgi:hypothetical protein